MYVTKAKFYIKHKYRDTFCEEVDFEGSTREDIKEQILKQKRLIQKKVGLPITYTFTIKRKAVERTEEIVSKDIVTSKDLSSEEAIKHIKETPVDELIQQDFLSPDEHRITIKRSYNKKVENHE